jgi:hypothetical protein
MCAFTLPRKVRTYTRKICLTVVTSNNTFQVSCTEFRLIYVGEFVAILMNKDDDMILVTSLRNGSLISLMFAT